MSELPLSQAELLNRVLDARLADVHTSAVGVVVSYDSANHTADVQLAAKKQVKAWDDSVAYEDPPILPAVPVCAFGTAREFNRVTLQAGDSVWLIFAEQSPAEYLDSGSVSEPGDTARHSMSGALAIPFVRPGQLPDEPKVQLGGDLGAQFVALASLVDLNFKAIQTAWDAFAAAGFLSGDPTLTVLAAAMQLAAAPTACTTTKAL
jgi:hypothetical protein